MPKVIKPAFEVILDESLRLLKEGKSISYCLKQYPNIPGLESALMLAQSLRRLPVKEVTLSQHNVWSKVISSMTQQRHSAKPLFTLPFFRIAVPRTVFAVITLVLVGGLVNSTAVVAQNSLPGDTLYPVKRTVEKIQLTLTLDEAQKAEVRLQHAQNRLSEAKTIVDQQSSPNPATIQKAVTEFADGTSQVAQDSSGNKDILKKVVELSDKQQAVLSDIETKSPDTTTKEAVTKAIDSSMQTKNNAQENLAKLEEKPNNTTATSTVQVKGATTTAATTTTPISGKHDTKPADAASVNGTNKTPTSTGDTLKAWGTPNATTTDPLPLNTPSSTETTTTQIINLK